jgi:hypothetical protein
LAVNFTPHPRIAPCKSVYDADLLELRKTLGLSHKVALEDIHTLSKHPDFKWQSDCYYRYDYERIFRDIAAGEDHDREARAKGAQRMLIRNDIFYILIWVMGIEKANHPFVVERCRALQDGPQSDTLDVHARFHYKSLTITIAETLQYHLKYPEECTCILGYARPVAKKFLRAIKTLCEQSVLLKWAFDDILWQNPTQDAPKWSEDDGIVFKRKSASRGESTIEAYGLTEGSPTGRHYERIIFDDIETEDIAGSPKMLEEVFSKFQMCVYNLGTGSDNDKRRVIGTYYSWVGPVKRIGDMKFEDGRPMWQLRVVPATDDGTINGNPVLLDPDTWERIKRTKHVNSQQLCDPSPREDITLDIGMLQPIDPAFLRVGKWADRFKFFVIDQAGGTDTNISGPGDNWSVGVVSIVPSQALMSRKGDEATDDDLGISDVCLEDVVADRLTHSQAIDTVVRMYIRSGMIMQLGVEKVGLSTTEIHIADALAAKGRKLSVQHGNLFLLRPGGRSTENRISSALEWPLNNSKLYYSTGIAPEYVEKMKQEMDQFGFAHSDILNMWAYFYDMVRVFPFHRYQKRKVQSVTSLMAAGNGGQRVKGEWG